jgi:hypothetical protein
MPRYHPQLHRIIESCLPSMSRYVAKNFNPEGIFAEIAILLRRIITAEEIDFIWKVIEEVDTGHPHYYGLDYYAEVLHECSKRRGWHFIDPYFCIRCLESHKPTDECPWDIELEEMKREQ